MCRECYIQIDKEKNRRGIRLQSFSFDVIYYVSEKTIFIHSILHNYHPYRNPNRIKSRHIIEMFYNYEEFTNYMTAFVLKSLKLIFYYSEEGSHTSLTVKTSGKSSIVFS